MPAGQPARTCFGWYHRHIVRRSSGRCPPCCGRWRRCSGPGHALLFPAGQTELLDYVEHLVAELPLPLVLYNMPSLTKVWFELETLQKLTNIQQIVGIKDSSGDLTYFASLMTLRQQRPDWSIMIGPEAMLPQAMALGGDGGVTGGANRFQNYSSSCMKHRSLATLSDWHRRKRRSKSCKPFTRSANTLLASSKRRSALCP